MNKTYSILGTATLSLSLIASTLAGCSSSKAKDGNSTGGDGGEAGTSTAGKGSGGKSTGGNGGNSNQSGGSSNQSGGSSNQSGGSSSSNGGTGGTSGSTGNGGATSGGSSANLSPFSRITASVTSTTLRIVGDQSLAVTVTINRDGTDNGDVNLSVKGLPFAVSAPSVTASSGTKTAQLQFKADVTAQIGGPYALNIVVASAADSSVSTTIPVTLYIAQPAGSLDVSLGRGGVAILKAIPQGTDTDPPLDQATGVAVDGQGRIAVVGYSNGASQRGWVLRLAADGSLDSTFATGGRLTSFGQTPSYVDNVGYFNNQLYVAARATSTTGNSVVSFLRRIGDSGGGDSTFNGGLDYILTGTSPPMAPFKGGVVLSAPAPMVVTADGKLDTSFVARKDLVQANLLAVDSSNRVVYSDPSGGSTDFILGRLTPTGAADSTFGSSGVIHSPCPSTSTRTVPGSVRALTVTADITTFALTNCGASVRDPYEWEGALLAYSASGSPILGFGQSGRLVVTSPGYGQDAFAQADGKMVVLVVNYSHDASLNVLRAWAVRRFATTSATDSAFGQSGTVDLTKQASGLEAIAMAYDAAAQRAVIVGNDSSGGIAVLRVWL